jgi:Tol biopolymer transport system component
LWTVDLMRGTSTRLTFSRTVAGAGVWSPDGNYLAYAANPGGTPGLYRKAASGAGSEELVWKTSEQLLGATHWSADGRFLFIGLSSSRPADIWVVPMTGERKAYPLLNTEFAELGGRFSPDGHWFAYNSTESGRNETYVQPFNPDAAPGAAVGASAGKWLVSKGASAGMPRWRADMKEFYYLTPDRKVMAVEISTTPAFKAGEPKQLFQLGMGAPQGPAPGAQADVAADGKRFLFLVAPGVANAQQGMTVVTNWTAVLKK